MKKFLFLVFLAYLIAGINHVNAQIKKTNTQTINKSSISKSKKKSSVPKCQQLSVRIVNGILNNSVAKSLEVYLDRDNSYIKLMGTTNKLIIPEKEIQAARKWKYFVNDIKSIKSWAEFDKRTKHFILSIEFEGNDSEIKGKCPSCLKRFRDSRAPDLNWTGKRIAKIRLKPIPYDNSITFNVEKVDLIGKFDLNGPLEAMFPPMVKFFETRIKKEIENQTRKSLNSTKNKKAIADALRGSIALLRLNGVRSVETTDSNLYICD